MWEASGITPARATVLHRHPVLRPLTCLRHVSAHEIPPVIRGIVDVDKTSQRCAPKNTLSMRVCARTRPNKTGRFCSPPPIFIHVIRGVTLLIHRTRLGNISWPVHTLQVLSQLREKTQTVLNRCDGQAQPAKPDSGHGSISCILCISCCDHKY